MAEHDFLSVTRAMLERRLEQIEALQKEIEAIRAVNRLYFQDDLQQGDESSVSIQRSSNGRELRDALYRHLIEVGRPMNRRELLDHMTRLGVPVGGDVPLNNIGAHMSNDARFKSLGEGMWGLREWSHPPSDDDPEDLPF